MTISQKAKHNIAITFLSLTAIIWGAGFLLSKMLLASGFESIPLTLNALRFSIAAVALLIVFCKKIKLSKQLVLFGILGGIMLFGGFALQIVGLKYTTPSSSGFFTVSYCLIVPFLIWIFFKKRPTKLVFVGILCAFVGLFALNVPKQSTEHLGSEFFGNMLTLASALFFAAQIVLTDYSMKSRSLSAEGLTVLQIVACAVCFALASLIFESKNYSALEIDWSVCWWPMAIISLGGTAFAYFSQTYAQKHLSATETSIIVSTESPINALLSVFLGIENVSWQLCVGGVFIIAAIVFVEILPNILKKQENPPTTKAS